MLAAGSMTTESAMSAAKAVLAKPMGDPVGAEMSDPVRRTSSDDFVSILVAFQVVRSWQHIIGLLLGWGNLPGGGGRPGLALALETCWRHAPASSLGSVPGAAGNKNDNLLAQALHALRRGIRRLGTIFMVALKRFIRPGFVFSVVGHGGLLLGLLFVGPGGVQSVPPEAVTVEIVPSNEVPQIETTQVEGTPLDSTSSGSEVSSDSEKGSASAEAPRPKLTRAPSLQQAQADLNQQHSDSLAAAQPQAAQPLAAQPVERETQPEESEPLLPPTTPTVQPQPNPKEAASQPNAGEMFAMPLALPGGRLGGGFDAPSSNPAMLPHDDTAAFRARLSSCSQLPAGFDMDEKVAIVLRISFKRDGTLASAPELLRASLSPDAAALMNTAVSALQRCQPFTELPADKYRKWKTLDLVVTPLALSGG